jgi:hypothetical protein
VAKVACLEPRRLLALKTGIMDKKKGALWVIAMKIHQLPVKRLKNRSQMHYSGCSAKSYLQ